MAGPGKLRSQALWSLALQLSRFGGNAVIFLVMARYLTIAEIGAFAMAYAPVRWTQALHKSGIADSVVVTGDADPDTDARALTALFWLALVLSGVIGIGLIGLAAAMGGQTTVGRMMLAMLVLPVFSGLASVPEGLLLRRLQVRALALRSLAIQVLAAIAAIALAWQGRGGWALVGFVVLSGGLNMVLSVSLAGWWPRGGPDVSAMRAELSRMLAISGRALMLAGLMPLLQFCTGLWLGLPAAGAFQIAQRVFRLLDAVSVAPVRFLVLALFARAAGQGAGTLPAGTVLRALRVAGLISTPVFLGAALLAYPALALVIGPDNAGPSAAPLRILCLWGPGLTLATVLGQAATATGAPMIPFRRAARTLALTVVLALPALVVSLEAAVLGFVVASYGALALFLREVPERIGVGAAECLIAVGRPCLAGGLACSVVLIGLPPDAGPWATAPVSGLLYVIFLRVLAQAALSDMRDALAR